MEGDWNDLARGDHWEPLLAGVDNAGLTAPEASFSEVHFKHCYGAFWHPE